MTLTSALAGASDAGASKGGAAAGAGASAGAGAADAAGADDAAGMSASISAALASTPLDAAVLDEDALAGGISASVPEGSPLLKSGSPGCENLAVTVLHFDLAVTAGQTEAKALLCAQGSFDNSQHHTSKLPVLHAGQGGGPRRDVFLLNVTFAGAGAICATALQRSTGMLVLLKEDAHSDTVDASVSLALLALSELHTQSVLLSHPME